MTAGPKFIIGNSHSGSPILGASVCTVYVLLFQDSPDNKESCRSNYGYPRKRRKDKRHKPEQIADKGNHRLSTVSL